MSQNNSKQDTKAGSLAEMLAAKAKATETPKENPLTPTPAVSRVEPPLEIEKPLPDDPPAPEHNFRVFNHRYEFKVNSRVLKPTKENTYIPESKEEFEFLRLQVERGLVHFY